MPELTPMERLYNLPVVQRVFRPQSDDDRSFRMFLIIMGGGIGVASCGMVGSAVFLAASTFLGDNRETINTAFRNWLLGEDSSFYCGPLEQLGVEYQGMPFITVFSDVGDVATDQAAVMYQRLFDLANDIIIKRGFSEDQAREYFGETLFEKIANEYGTNNVCAPLIESANPGLLASLPLQEGPGLETLTENLRHAFMPLIEASEVVYDIGIKTLGVTAAALVVAYGAKTIHQTATAYGGIQNIPVAVKDGLVDIAKEYKDTVTNGIHALKNIPSLV